MEPVIDHIQITVRDFPIAVEFYDQLMPILGFDPEKRTSATVSAHDLHVVEYLARLVEICWSAGSSQPKLV